MTTPPVIAARTIETPLYAELAQNSPPASFSFDLPKSGMKPVFFPDQKLMAIIAKVPTYTSSGQHLGDEDRKVLIYNYESGIALFEFETQHGIWSLFAIDCTLYINANTLQAFNVSAFVWVDLKYSPNISPRTLCIGDHFAAYLNYPQMTEGKDQQARYQICIADPKNLEPKKILPSDSALEMLIDGEDLYILGSENTSSYDGRYGNAGYLIKYENPQKSAESPLKVNFECSHRLNTELTLSVTNDVVYIPTWTTNSKILWEAKTLNAIYEKKSEGRGNVMTRIMNNSCVICDSKSMDFLYKKEGQFIEVKQIECDQNDPATYLNFLSIDSLIEGYSSGIIRIRNLADYKINKEFRPPEDMTGILSTTVVKDKLIAHYKNPSREGNLFVIWDLQTQQPTMMMGSDAIKNKNYESQIDDFAVVGQDIVVRIENRAFLYKGVLA